MAFVLWGIFSVKVGTNFINFFKSGTVRKMYSKAILAIHISYTIQSGMCDPWVAYSVKRPLLSGIQFMMYA